MSRSGLSRLKKSRSDDMPKLPGVNHQLAVRVFGKLGFAIERNGGHIVMKKGSRRVVIPRNNPINAFTMGEIVQSAGLTIEEFEKLL